MAVTICVVSFTIPTTCRLYVSWTLYILSYSQPYRYAISFVALKVTFPHPIKSFPTSTEFIYKSIPCSPSSSSCSFWNISSSASLSLPSPSSFDGHSILMSSFAASSTLILLACRSLAPLIHNSCEKFQNLMIIYQLSCTI